jgi:hypothetical protein
VDLYTAGAQPSWRTNKWAVRSIAHCPYESSQIPSEGLCWIQINRLCIGCRAIYENDLFLFVGILWSLRVNVWFSCLWTGNIWGLLWNVFYCAMINHRSRVVRPRCSGSRPHVAAINWVSKIFSLWLLCNFWEIVSTFFFVDILWWIITLKSPWDYTNKGYLANVISGLNALILISTQKNWYTNFLLKAFLSVPLIINL